MDDGEKIQAILKICTASHTTSKGRWDNRLKEIQKILDEESTEKKWTYD